MKRRSQINNCSLLAVCNAEFLGGILRNSSDYDTFDFFLSFLSSTDPCQWKSEFIDSEMRKLVAGFVTRRQDFGISITDPKWKAFENWMNIVNGIR